MFTKRTKLISSLASGGMLLGLAYPCHSQAQPPALVQGIDAKALCKRLGLPAPIPGARLFLQYVRYRLPRTRVKQPHPVSFTLAVYSTLGQAITAFNRTTIEEGAY